jgi:hypothetical protein
MLVKYVSIDGIPEAFLSFRFVDNHHHSSWPFLECRPSKLYFKIRWKYDDWSFRFHHFLENGRFYRENTMTSLVPCCARIVNQNKWPTLLHDRADVTSRYIYTYDSTLKFRRWKCHAQCSALPETDWTGLTIHLWPSKLYFKIRWKYDDWSFRFHHFLENGRFYRENTYKCSPLVTKWQIILLSQSGKNTVVLTLFVIMTCFLPR